MMWDVSDSHGQRGEEPGSNGDAATVQAAAPAISGVAVFEHLSIGVPGIPLDASPSPSNTGLSPVAPQTEESAGDREFPPAGERRSLPPHADAGFVGGSTMQPEVALPPTVPERPAEAAGNGAARHVITFLTPATPPPSRPGFDLPRESGRHVPAMISKEQGGEPSTSLPAPSQEYALYRLAPSDSTGTVTTGPVELAVVEERQVSASPKPPYSMPGNPEPVVSSTYPPQDRDVPNSVDAGTWPRENAAAHSTVIEPRVHIGRIDIVVQAPESPRQAPSPATSPSDLSSRLYLRRL